jgi:hypothetical protein
LFALLTPLLEVMDSNEDDDEDQAIDDDGSRAAAISVAALRNL